MTRKKRGPLGYIFSASLLPICLQCIYHEFGIENNNNYEVIVFCYLIFLMLSVLWDIFGMISLVAEDARWRLVIGVSAVLFQMGVYYYLWQALDIKIGEIF